MLRKQYHSRKIGPDVHVWDVHRLIRLSKAHAPQMMALTAFSELDEDWWYDHASDRPTPRALADHMRLVLAADLAYPVLLSADGRLMDGMHRLVKALVEGRSHVAAIRFPVTPPPDFLNVSLDELPYPDEEV